MTEAARIRRLRLGIPVLLGVVRAPARLGSIDEAEWEPLLLAAERARLQAWLGAEAERVNAPAPAWAVARLQSARATGRQFRRAILWEVNRIRRALWSLGIEPVLLKGAAYVVADLPIASGRIVADVDVLVREEQLAAVEGALREHGWIFAPLDSYDERFYREWMHELPPLFHPGRSATLDLHHRILPRTGRVHPSTERLLANSTAVPGLDVRVLAPPHMLLHAAAHLFQDGEVAGALRDVVDVHGMTTHFAGRPEFWDDVLDEATALGLERPLYYALRYATRFCGTVIPPAAQSRLDRFGASAGARALMDRLVATSFERGAGALAEASALALYTRAHWLRMPPLMLARHLARKGWRRAAGTAAGSQ